MLQIYARVAELNINKSTVLWYVTQLTVTDCIPVTSNNTFD